MSPEVQMLAMQHDTGTSRARIKAHAPHENFHARALGQADFNNSCLENSNNDLLNSAEGLQRPIAARELRSTVLSFGHVSKVMLFLAYSRRATLPGEN